MAGFSLSRGAGSGNQEDDPDQIPFLYAGGNSGATAATSASRGFELWQIQRHHQQQQHQFYSAAPTMLGFSTDEQQQGLAGPSGSGSGSGSGVGGRGMRGSSSSGGGMSCQDCGNQAKKDCVHMRCRTCCKSRGFPCPTHVKSTWVPASKRRERQQQQQLAAAAAAGASGSGAAAPHHQLQSRDISKRPREIFTTRVSSALATMASGEKEAVTNFPTEVSSPAVFRCVRVSQLDEGEDEYAYQTSVSIGGHLFRGILYDHGSESQYHQQQHLQGESSSIAATISASTTALTASTGNITGSVSVGLIDPSSVYPTPLSAFMAGTQFFPHHPHPRP